MVRPKKRSQSLARAEIRLLGMQSINPKLDLGQGLSITVYTDLIDSLQQKLQSYNLLLADLDAMRSEIIEDERKLSLFSSKILAGVGHLFGKHSVEYEKVGGTRQVERIRSSRRSSSSPTETNAASANPPETTD